MTPFFHFIIIVNLFIPIEFLNIIVYKTPKFGNLINLGPEYPNFEVTSLLIFISANASNKFPLNENPDTGITLSPSW